MRRCFQLAAHGLGRVRPNPMVGCVIVKDGHIVSEGFHQQYGGYHAERNAILMAKDKSDLRGATLYVNLEPCSHYGKTPPCADLVVDSGIVRVVCCNDDPNPLVAGRGFEKLQAAGIEVVSHVLEREGRWLNRRFFTFMELHRPYIILKWAESADGFMSPDGGQCAPGCQQKSYWLSTPQQTLISHQWRTEEAAILVGSQTYLDDHPQLTARLFYGQQPQPVVLDRRGRLSDVPRHWLHLSCQHLDQAMHELFQKNIQSLIVEGGRQVLDAFLAAGLYDEVRVVRTPVLLGGGLSAPQPPADKVTFYDA